MTETAVTYRRPCQACCGLLVDIDDGRVVTARGDGDNPASRGFTCPKGRNIGEYHHHPDRLLGSRGRDASGEWSTIATDIAIEEVGRRLQEIREAHGPDAIATFWGTQANLVTPTRLVALKWWKALGSHKACTTATIVQSAKVVIALGPRAFIRRHGGAGRPGTSTQYAPARPGHGTAPASGSGGRAVRYGGRPMSAGAR